MKLRNRKTGEVVNGAIILKTEDQKDPWYFDSISELVEHWEDYKGPLIKDEKIRKAVKKAYELGYHDGFSNACDTTMLHLHKKIVDYLVDMKKSAKDCEVVAIDEYEGEE